MWLYILLGLACLIFYWYRKSSERVGEYEAQGLKGTKPMPFLGVENFDLFMGKKSLLDSIKERIERFKGEPVIQKIFL